MDHRRKKCNTQPQKDIIDLLCTFNTVADFPFPAHIVVSF